MGGWQNWDRKYKTGNFSPVSIDFLAILVLPTKISQKHGGEIWGLGFRRPRAQLKHVGACVANDVALGGKKSSSFRFFHRM